MQFFAKIVNGFYSFTSFAKKSILDVWQGSEYVSVRFCILLVKSDIEGDQILLIYETSFFLRCVSNHPILKFYIVYSYFYAAFQVHLSYSHLYL